MFKKGDEIILKPRTRAFLAKEGTICTAYSDSYIESWSGLGTWEVKVSFPKGSRQCDGGYSVEDFELYIREQPYDPTQMGDKEDDI